MKKITLLKHLTAVVAVVAMTLVGAFLSVGVHAWGPEDRPIYTNESPASYATFNSITNNVAVGDERNFVRVAEVGTSDTYVDEIEVVPGKEYEVYIYYHNNAASNTNTSGYGVATNVKVSSAYPPVLNPGERGMISGIISWSYVTPSDPNNAKTGTVWDEAYLTTKYDDVVLRYKTGSAIIHNGGKANGSVLPTNLFTEEGTPIGYNKLSGTLPGCAEYSGYITYTLVAEYTASELSKSVSLDGENWSEMVETDPGQYATYKVTFKNTGNTTLTNVIFKDSHSEGLKLRYGSVKVFDAENTSGKVIDDILDISGYNVGDVAPGALVQIIYQAKVEDDATCKELKNNIAVAYNGKNQKIASSTVKSTGCNPQEDPTPVPAPDPEPEPTPTPSPDIPSELPNTGPVEIVLAVIIVLGIAVGVFYLYRTRKTLNVVKKNVSGKKSAEKDVKTDSAEGAETKEAKETPEDKKSE